MFFVIVIERKYGEILTKTLTFQRLSGVNHTQTHFIPLFSMKQSALLINVCVMFVNRSNNLLSPTSLKMLFLILQRNRFWKICRLESGNCQSMLYELRRQTHAHMSWHLFSLVDRQPSPFKLHMEKSIKLQHCIFSYSLWLKQSFLS